MAVNYKTLFEVKILHEYYLTKRDGETIFDKATQAERLSFLSEQYVKGSESVNQNLDFLFPHHLQTLYESYYLKLIPSYSGFRVMIRVNKKTLNDDSIVYKPVVNLPPDLSIQVLLVKQSGEMDAHSGGRLFRSIPAVYFFTNRNTTAEKTYPFLSNPVPAFHSNYVYEQGELALFGNEVRVFHMNTAGEQWTSLTGTNFSNETDRILLPTRFTYFFPSGSAIKDVVFTLKNNSGQVVETIQKSSTEPLVRISLDLSNHITSATNSQPATFTLDVNSNSFMRSHYIRMSNDYARFPLWGLISMDVKADKAEFDLLATDGFLHKRITNTLTIDHPVFEIPVRSRYMYWRYVNDRKKPIVHNILFDGYLEEENGTWITKRPRPLAKYFKRLRKEDGSEFHFFPNPSTYSVITDQQGRMFFDVQVPKSTLFSTN